MDMKKTVQYTTDSEKTELIQQNSNLTLISESNITEGNFLVFSDNPSVDSMEITTIDVTDFKVTLLEESQIEQDELIMSLLLGGM